MEMYKVGDEVLIKGEVIEVMNDVPYPVRVRLGSDNGGLVFTNDEVCYAEKIVKTYEMGLNDAWKLAKKILKNRKPDEICELFNCLGVTSTYEIFENLTAAEALAKIEAYEKEIKVGDVVYYSKDGEISMQSIVTRIEGDVVYTVYSDGSCGREYYPNDLKKTGKHIDIESLLKQIGE